MSQSPAASPLPSSSKPSSTPHVRPFHTMRRAAFLSAPRFQGSAFRRLAWLLPHTEPRRKYSVAISPQGQPTTARWRHLYTRSIMNPEAQAFVPRFGHDLCGRRRRLPQGIRYPSGWPSRPCNGLIHYSIYSAFIDQNNPLQSIILPSRYRVHRKQHV
jgi:hypothetical protein